MGDDGEQQLKSIRYLMSQNVYVKHLVYNHPKVLRIPSVQFVLFDIPKEWQGISRSPHHHTTTPPQPPSSPHHHISTAPQSFIHAFPTAAELPRMSFLLFLCDAGR